MKLMKAGYIRELPNIIEQKVIDSHPHALRIQQEFNKANDISASTN